MKNFNDDEYAIDSRVETILKVEIAGISIDPDEVMAINTPDNDSPFWDIYLNDGRTILTTEVVHIETKVKAVAPVTRKPIGPAPVSRISPSPDIKGQEDGKK